MKTQGMENDNYFIDLSGKKIRYTNLDKENKLVLEPELDKYENNTIEFNKEES